MNVPKGYRARQAAARLRNKHRLVSEDARAQRFAALPGNSEPEQVESVTVTAEPAKEVVEVQTLVVQNPVAEVAEQEPVAEVHEADATEANKAVKKHGKTKHKKADA